MSPLDGTGPVMLNMAFESRLDGAALDAASERLTRRLRATPGVVAAGASVDPTGRRVVAVCVFEGLLARERFVLSSLYDRLPAEAGMVPGSRRTRRLDLGATDRDDLAVLAGVAPAQGRRAESAGDRR